MNRLLEHIGKYNDIGDAVSFGKIIRRKKENGASVGDMRRLIKHQGCFSQRCCFCSSVKGNKSLKKSKGWQKEDRNFLRFYGL